MAEAGSQETSQRTFTSPAAIRDVKSKQCGVHGGEELQRRRDDHQTHQPVKISNSPGAAARTASLPATAPATACRSEAGDGPEAERRMVCRFRGGSFVERVGGRAIGTTSQALAIQFGSKLHDAVALLRTLDDTDWKKVTVAEQWSVGVTAHHYASILESVGELVSALAAGQAPEGFTRATLDEMNALHARDHAHCTRAETIALLEKSGASTAAVLRGLSDEQLAKRGTVLTDAPPLTVEQLIALVLIKHADQHFGNIRKTIGR